MTRKSKDKRKQSFFSRFFVVLMIVVAVIFVLGIVREYVKRVELDREISQLENELEKLKLKKKNFLSSIDAYGSEFFVEQEARMKFNLKKPEEQVVIIPVNKISEEAITKNNNTDENNNKTNNKQVNLFAWWQYFFS